MATIDLGNDVGCVAATSTATVRDYMHLEYSDHPGMILVSIPMTGNNYLSWSRAIQQALAVNMKLYFSDGTLVRPAGNLEEFKRWNCIDSMVTTWILNSISKELVGIFQYVGSACGLWLELKTKFCESNDPAICQVEHDISLIAQGNMSIIEYYT
ncbi:UNVERIFIED_CONTAM: hypothetical protein Scaly_0048300 [Sesamum calycinum]|uniref:Retrotransposon Copia-like N-terminal domain-containing protein n=1 Tax=Sesamum calycinum TaxID=2727403 RepID=A0AAW2SUM5_9LAMI